MLKKLFSLLVLSLVLFSCEQQQQSQDKVSVEEKFLDKVDGIVFGSRVKSSRKVTSTYYVYRKEIGAILYYWSIESRYSGKVIQEDADLIPVSNAKRVLGKTLNANPKLEINDKVYNICERDGSRYLMGKTRNPKRSVNGNLISECPNLTEITNKKYTIRYDNINGYKLIVSDNSSFSTEATKAFNMMPAEYQYDDVREIIAKYVKDASSPIDVTNLRALF